MTTPLDITIVSKEDFFKARDYVAKTQPCNKITQLYVALFRDHECFHKNEPAFQQHSHTSQHPMKGSFVNKYPSKNTRHQQKTNYHNSFSVSKTSLANNRPSKPITKVFDGSLSNDPMAETKRKLKGLLNIINANNYKKVVPKIKTLLSEENAISIYQIILATTCNQVFYISVFMNLINELILHKQETKVVCTDVINDFIESFINNKEYVVNSNRQHSSNNEYEMFCAQQKHKCIITAKNLVIIQLLKKQFSKIWTVQAYVNQLLQTLHCLYKEPVLDKCGIEVNTDMILTLIKDLKNVDKNIEIDASVISNIMQKHEHSQRIMFMIQDILDMAFSNLK